MHHLKHKIEKVPIPIFRAPCIDLGYGMPISVKMIVRMIVRMIVTMIVNAGRIVILRVIRGKKIRLRTKNRSTIDSQPLSDGAKGTQIERINMTDQKNYQTWL